MDSTNVVIHAAGAASTVGVAGWEGLLFYAAAELLKVGFLWLRSKFRNNGK